MIEVESSVPVYEIDGHEIALGKTVALRVLSHWNRDSMVVLEIDGKKYTVSGHDLSAAVTNAKNTVRHG